MQFCNRCNIAITGMKKCCPLCEGELTGEPDMEAAAFPVIRSKKRTFPLLLKVAAFIVLVCCIVLCVLMLALPGKQMWAWLTMLILAITWVDLAVGCRYRYNPIHLVSVELLLFILLLYMIDRVTGMHGWSVTWVNPILFPVAVITQFSIGKGLGMYLDEFIIYPACTAVLSLIQIFFFGQNNFPMPAICSMAILAVTGLGFLIFGFHALREALHRALNL